MRSIHTDKKGGGFYSTYYYDLYFTSTVLYGTFLESEGRPRPRPPDSRERPRVRSSSVFGTTKYSIFLFLEIVG